MSEPLNETPTAYDDNVQVGNDSPRPEIDAAPQPPRHRQSFWQTINWWDVATVLLLAILVVSGYALRSAGRNWDDYTQLHPDERFLSDMASTVRSGPVMRPAARSDVSIQEQFQTCYGVNSAEEFGRLSVQERFERRAELGRGGYFDALCSELNVNVVRETIWVYGQFPLFSTRALAETQSELTDTTVWNSYTQIRLVGRTMSSVVDTLVIVLVFLIGARLLGRVPGLLAAGFYTFAAFPIQQSHFWTADAFTSFWVVLAIYFVVRILDNGSNIRERYGMLPWVGTGLAIWLHNLRLLDEADRAITIESLGIMLAVFLGVGLWNTATAVRDAAPFGFLGTILGGVMLAGHGLPGEQFVLNEAIIASLVILAALSALWQIGYHKFVGYAGLFPWLASAFGLWVFDAFAHYGYDDTFTLIPPRIENLIAYLLFFTATGLLASGLRYGGFRNVANVLLAIGVPFFIFWGGVYFAVIGGMSLWGIVSVVGLAAFVGVSTYFGYRDEVGFGLAFGAAMAGRVNVLPLVGLIFLVLLLRALVIVDWRVFRLERNQRFTRLSAALILAGVATIIAFRFLQPHAFLGPNLITFELNAGWLDDIAEAQNLVSGNADIPPNYQWVNRTPWLYPLQNISLYGLGLPLGLAAWGAALWALVRVLRGKQDWTRLAIPVAWVAVYFGWLGQNWVTTMRYFLPIYGMLTLFAAWGLTELTTMAWRSWRAMPQQFNRRLALASAGLVMLLVVGHTVMYGIGFSNIHTTQLTRVAAARYAQEFVPGDVGIWIETDDGRERMVNLSIYNFRSQPPNIRTVPQGETVSAALSPQFSSDLSGVSLNTVQDPQRDPEIERLRISVWSDGGSSGGRMLGAQLLEIDLSADGLGAQQFVSFDPPIPIITAADSAAVTGYTLRVEVLEGGPVTFVSRVQAQLDEDAAQAAGFGHFTAFYTDRVNNEVTTTQPLVLEQPEGFDDVTYMDAGTVLDFVFEANTTGTISELVIPHISDPTNDADPETLRVTLSDQPGNMTGQVNEVSGRITGDFNTALDGHLTFGPAVTIQLDTPFAVQSGQRYTIFLEAEDMLGIAGSAVAWEGAWDDPMPYAVCPIPNDMFFSKDLPSGMCDLSSNAVNLYSGHYIGFTQQMHWPDEPDKRDLTLEVLNHTDYLFIGSNRFYDSFNRNPTRWPMSNDYYEALFNEELGFDLVEVFTSYAEFGPFTWVDQSLPHKDGLFGWQQEFEAEEAFHVYDHPAVFVFRKNSDYSPALAREVLDVSLRTAEDATNAPFWVGASDPLPVNRLTWDSATASASPNALQFSDPEEEIQQSGGTWSDLFNRGSIINQNQVIGVAVWWLLMVVVGWFTFPLLHWILPGLPDRGFAAGKLVGWLIVAWVAWAAASLRFEVWTQGWLFLILLGFFALNAALAWWRRHELLAFVQRRWKHLLFVEVLALVLYLAFIGVRLGNPDLWHDVFGGEKPMNVAYFNAVLRSSIFPPIDPWYAGGYINYYYWGYVLVGAPTKLLGMMPQFAYNLILPTLFSMTGMGAFAVSYNLVQWIRERHAERAQDDETATTTSAASNTDHKPHWREVFGPIANPYFAGIATLLLAVVLGNLGTMREFTRGLSSVGGWRGPAAYEEQLLAREIDNYRQVNGREPNPLEVEAMREDVELSNLEATEEWLNAMWDGLVSVSSGETTMAVPAHRWYWGPSRVIGELSEGRGHNAITEMPYFTFLYGDMHAHMMSMPLQLLVVLILTSEILGAGRRLRGAVPALLALLLLGATAGLLRPTNTWDWPTYMVLSLAGLTFAAWVGQGRLRGDLPPSPLFERLRSYLDVRNLSKLWPLLFVVPLGMALYMGSYLYESRTYESDLQRGEIPLFCQNLDTSRPELIPAACEEFLEPELSLVSALSWGAAGLVIVALAYMAGLVVLGNRFDRDALMQWVGRLAVFGIASVVAIWPYMNRYATAFGEVIEWELDKTPQWTYLTVHGVFIFIITSFFIWQTARWLREHTVADLRGLSLPFLTVIGFIVALIGATMVFGVFGEYRVFISALPLFGWAAVLYLLPHQSHAIRWTYILIGLALGLTMSVEVFALAGDNGRQNMVFKFYMQVWLLFSIASGVALAWLVRSLERWSPSISGVWQMSLAVLLTLALLFPITATQGRWKDRFNADVTPLTLDGMEFMKYAGYSTISTENEMAGRGENAVGFNLRGDYEMIRWLQDNVEGTPYIVEGWQTQYRWTSRISIHTGLPTVIGWDGHQSQQRNLQNFNRLIVNRVNNVKALYDTTDIQEAMNLIEFYDIEYIVVGTFERITYNDILPARPSSEIEAERTMRHGLSPGLAKFDRMVEQGLLEVAYSNHVCVSRDIFEAETCPADQISTDIVYRVVPGATDAVDNVVQASR